LKALIIFAISLNLAAVSPESRGGYHIVKKVPIAGQGSWDYLAVDADARRLYGKSQASAFRGNHVEVYRVPMSGAGSEVF
jgi:hypothetical protein